MLDYILIINLMHWLSFIKHYSPLHVSSLKCSFQEDTAV